MVISKLEEIWKVHIDPSRLHLPELSSMVMVDSPPSRTPGFVSNHCLFYSNCWVLRCKNSQLHICLFKNTASLRRRLKEVPKHSPPVYWRWHAALLIHADKWLANVNRHHWVQSLLQNLQHRFYRLAELWVARVQEHFVPNSKRNLFHSMTL